MIITKWQNALNNLQDDISDWNKRRDLCDEWFHLKCVNLSSTPAEDEEWLCLSCVSGDEYKMNSRTDKQWAVTDSLKL